MSEVSRLKEIRKEPFAFLDAIDIFLDNSPFYDTASTETLASSQILERQAKRVERTKPFAIEIEDEHTVSFPGGTEDFERRYMLVFFPSADPSEKNNVHRYVYVHKIDEEDDGVNTTTDVGNFQLGKIGDNMDDSFYEDCKEMFNINFMSDAEYKNWISEAPFALCAWNMTAIKEAILAIYNEYGLPHAKAAAEKFF